MVWSNQTHIVHHKHLWNRLNVLLSSSFCRRVQESERKAYNPRPFCKTYTMDKQPLNTGEQKDMTEFFTDLITKIEEMSQELVNTRRFTPVWSAAALYTMSLEQVLLYSSSKILGIFLNANLCRNFFKKLQRFSCRVLEEIKTCWWGKNEYEDSLFHVFNSIITFEVTDVSYLSFLTEKHSEDSVRRRHHQQRRLSGEFEEIRVFFSFTFLWTWYLKNTSRDRL